jgi:pentatricopeptide repeat protein
VTTSNEAIRHTEQKAMTIFDQSRKQDAVLYTVFLKGISKMSMHDQGDGTSFTSGLVQNKQAPQALEYFRQMTVSADEILLCTIFKICSQLGDAQSVEFARQLLRTLPDKYRNDHFLLNAALHLLMKAGHVTEGEQLFQQMDKDSSTYRIMTCGNSILSVGLSFARTEIRLRDESSTGEGHRSVLPSVRKRSLHLRGILQCLCCSSDQRLVSDG